MVQPSPRDETVELFNQLADLPREDATEIGQIAWRLRKLAGPRHGGLLAKLGLIRAHMLLGEAAEAGVLAEEVVRVWHLLDMRLVRLLGAQLLELGYYSESLTLAENAGFNIDLPEVRVLVAKACWGLGRLDDIERSTALIASGEAAGHAWLRQMRTTGLDRHFEAHQRIVASHARGWQVFGETSFMGNSEGGAETTTLLYGAGTYSERRAREDALAADLDRYYDGVGSADLPFAELLGVTFLPLLAIPEVRGHSAAA